LNLSAQAPQSGDRDLEQTVQDAWIDGRLESTYIFNEHLGAAAIHTDVRNGIVTSTGTVEGDIDRDLAGEAEDRRSFGQWVNDATTSAAVKSALIPNENIRARDIDANTDNDVVTLRGVVG
jgi:osmotically-inducible protein OsmY